MKGGLHVPGYLNAAVGKPVSRGAAAFASALGSVPFSTRNSPMRAYRQFGTSPLADVPWYLTAQMLPPAYAAIPGTTPLVPNPYTGAGGVGGIGVLG